MKKCEVKDCKDEAKFYMGSWRLCSKHRDLMSHAQDLDRQANQGHQEQAQSSFCSSDASSDSSYSGDGGSFSGGGASDTF